jgi:hypothetical protein
MKRLIFSGLFSWVFLAALAQEKHILPELNLGLGLGIDYGGIGGRLTVSPVNHLILFGALGYNIAGVGYNIGAGYRFSPQKQFRPYVLGMYGYNTVVIALINGAYESQYTKTFYGPSLGVGFEQRNSSQGKNYFNLEVLAPLRSRAFKDYKDMLKAKDIKLYALPISISLGYHIGF